MYIKYMPDKNSIQYLEVKKHLSLLEGNLLSAIRNINSLTVEVERLRNALAAKEGVEDLEPPPIAPAPTPASMTEQQRGPSTGSAMSSSKGRTLKVINN